MSFPIIDKLGGWIEADTIMRANGIRAGRHNVRCQNVLSVRREFISVDFLDSMSQTDRHELPDYRQIRRLDRGRHYHESEWHTGVRRRAREVARASNPEERRHRPRGRRREPRHSVQRGRLRVPSAGQKWGLAMAYTDQFWRTRNARPVLDYELSTSDGESLPGVRSHDAAFLPSADDFYIPSFDGASWPDEGRRSGWLPQRPGRRASLIAEAVATLKIALGAAGFLLTLLAVFLAIRLLAPV